jgi:ADP-dependent NAD(P)H-hydrate dehydratase
LIALGEEVLRAWPLPVHEGGDKEERGRVLIIAGSRELAGAAVLAADSALRAGAGKVTVATGATVAPIVALAVPEARVIALPENDEGGFGHGAIERIGKLAQRADAVLVGPGMVDASTTCELAASLLRRLRHCPVILDALAMDVVKARVKRFDGPVLLTPHAGEMSHLTGIDKQQIEASQQAFALEWAKRWNALLVLKGETTYIAAPDGKAWCNERGSIGLAISGSGDTLAGIIAGLAARGASIEQATAWGVFLHARAGERLSKKIGPLGFLPREIPAEIPRLLADLS